MKKRSCIYKIINIVNGKFYVGSTVNIDNRIKEHLHHLRRGDHHSQPLQNSFNKHGESSFIFHIIEYTTEDKIRQYEQIYIDNLSPYYNTSKNANAPMEGRKHSKETCEKMAKWKRPSGADHHLYKKTWTLEQREKILAKRIGSKRSEETKRKMSETAKRLNRAQDLLKHNQKLKKQIRDNKNNTFNSLVEAATYYNISTATVCDILKGRHRRTRDGVTFYYLNEPNIH